MKVGTKSKNMNVFIKKGGLDAPTQWDNAGTFDWPDNTFYLLHDLIPNTHYGVKLMRFENDNGKLEGSVSRAVFIPLEGTQFTAALHFNLTNSNSSDGRLSFFHPQTLY